MRTRLRLSTIAAGVVGCVALLTACENGHRQSSGAAAGPNPAWIEQYHREQLRYEYERMKYAERMGEQ